MREGHPEMGMKEQLSMWWMGAGHTQGHDALGGCSIDLVMVSGNPIPGAGVILGSPQWLLPSL